jgi:hypothetical protein
VADIVSTPSSALLDEDRRRNNMLQKVRASYPTRFTGFEDNHSPLIKKRKRLPPATVRGKEFRIRMYHLAPQADQHETTIPH